jgi:CHAT domain-containing protein
MTPYGEDVHRVTVLKTSQERWNPSTNSFDREFTYNFLLDGEDCGTKELDGATREHFIRELFQIADILAQDATTAGLGRSAPTKIEHLGRSIYSLLIPELLRKRLFETVLNCTLIIDSSDQDIPWELLHDGNSFVSSRYALGRDIPSHKKISREYGRKGIHICLIGNPTEDLPSAQEEVDELRTLLEETLRRLKATYEVDTVLRVIEGEEALKSTILFNILLSDETPWDIIHYAGHASFDAARPNSSGLHLADGELKGFEIEEMKVNPIFFANACRSSIVLKDASLVGYGLMKGIAPSFIKGGAVGYIGTLWPVFDLPARRIATSFYKSIIEGATMGEALLVAKQDVAREFPNDPSPLGYVLFGDPRSRLPIYEPQLTSGPYINDTGFSYVFDIEREYNRLELLLVNDLPWILWREEDVMEWVNRIPVTEGRRNKMVMRLIEYRRYFNQLILAGQKTFKGIVNLKTLRSYLKQKSKDALGALLQDIDKLNTLDNFSLLFYEGGEDELEEIEIVSKNEDVFQDLKQSVYVFNKQTRFEKNLLTYYLYAEFNPSLIQEYANRFFGYRRLTIEQYRSRFSTLFQELNLESPSINSHLNTISRYILDQEIAQITG